MKAYWTVFRACFQSLLQYRAAAIAGFGTQLFWGFIRVMFFTAFYESTTTDQPMTLAETINYIWLGQALFLLIPWNRDFEMEAKIKSGNIAYELMRPIDLYGYWFARAVARRTAPVLLRCTPMIIIALLFLGLELPASPASFIAFLIAIAGGLLLSCAITLFITVTMFWTLAGDGIGRLVPSFMMLLGGLTVPLPLFPDWAQPILNALPFAGIVDHPFRLYMGLIPPNAVWDVVVLQLVWIGVLVIGGRMMISIGLRRLVLQGG